MAAAITLSFDTAGAASVASLWQVLAEAGVSTSMPRLAYVPHLTLLVWPEADAARLAAPMAAATELVPREIQLGPLGIVPSDPAVLWLGVVATAPLLALHARLAHAIGDVIHPHYRIGAWMAHITLALDLARPRIGQAVQLLADALPVGRLKIAAIEAVTFPPVRVMARDAIG